MNLTKFNEELTLLDYFAIHCPQPSKEDIDYEFRYDKLKNPYNEPSKSKLRSSSEIICDLRYKYAQELFEARKKLLK